MSKLLQRPNLIKTMVLPKIGASTVTKNLLEPGSLGYFKIRQSNKELPHQPIRQPTQKTVGIIALTTKLWFEDVQGDSSTDDGPRQSISTLLEFDMKTVAR